MSRRVAFLRAINVGGRRIKMDALGELFEDMGLAGVDTYLASGNVIFDAEEDRAALEERIAEHLDEHLGWEVPAYVRSIEELAEIAGRVPFADAFADVFAERIDLAPDARTKHYVTFLASPLESPQVAALESLANDVDAFAVAGHEIHWLRKVDAGDSMPTSELEKALGLQTTRRTLTTVQRIVKKYG